ncbi:hypothetical protein C359_06711 [Cryptococcus neoformans Bt120]|nr:hypothetical protein C359_06711 [Cryptococcus neoformans var. grubii Bt120]
MWTLMRFVSTEERGRGRWSSSAIARLPSGLLVKAPMVSKVGALRDLFIDHGIPFLVPRGWAVLMDCASDLLGDKAVSQSVLERVDVGLKDDSIV